MRDFHLCFSFIGPPPRDIFADIFRAVQTHNKQFLACSHSASPPHRTLLSGLSSSRAVSLRPSSPCLFAPPPSTRSILQHLHRARLDRLHLSAHCFNVVANFTWPTSHFQHLMCPFFLFLQYNSVNMKNKTAEEVYVEMLKPAETVTLKVQHRPDDFNLLKDAAGDGFYIRYVH